MYRYVFAGTDLRFLSGLLLSLIGVGHAQEIVTLSPRPGVTQSYFLARAPENPQAVAVLFPGSGGLIRLRMEAGHIKFSPNNFLVRSRGEFVNRAIVAAIVDAPSVTPYSDAARLSEKYPLDNSFWRSCSTIG